MKIFKVVDIRNLEKKMEQDNVFGQILTLIIFCIISFQAGKKAAERDNKNKGGI